MSTDEFESSLGRVGRTHTEGEYGRIVLGHEVPFARYQHGEGLARIEVGETCSTELLFHISGSKEVDGRCIEQGHQLLCNVVHIKCVFILLH